MTAPRHSSDTARRERFMSWVALILALLLGAFARLSYVFAADFPLNDGGLFYSMTQDLVRSRYALPFSTTYNGLSIPFAYPPLPFYIAALLAGVGKVPLLQVLRFLPALWSILTIPAFYWLCITLRPSRFQAGVATLAFALIPRSFLWLIMGGGLTRAPGLLFAILMLRETFLLYSRHDRRRVWTTAVLGGLTVLCHPAGAWFAAFSAALLFLLYGRDREGALHSLLVAAGVLAVSAPWWGTVLARHGASPLFAASETGGYAWFAWVRLVTLDFLEETFVGLLTAIGLVGAFFCMAERDWMLPAWLALVMILDPRSGGTYATLPLALLVAVGLERVILRALRTAETRAAQLRAVPGAAAPSWKLRGWVPRALLGFLLVHALVSAISIGVVRQSALAVLPREDRQAMAWVAANSPPDSRFVVLAAAQGWAFDYVAEWFPALAQRVSVATVQGYEWLSGGQFHPRVELYKALQECSEGAGQCLDEWAVANGVRFTHVYAHEPSFRVGPGKNGILAIPVLEQMVASSEYRVLYRQRGVTILARTMAAP